MRKAFEISLDFFEGPLDLLLHLVKKNEFNVEKISLALVSEQYLSCLEEIETIDVELAGEYLVVASTLLALKAKYIIDGELRDDIEDILISEESTQVEDELLKRMQELDKYRTAVEELGLRNMLDVDVFASSPPVALLDPNSIPLAPHNVISLGKILRNLQLSKVIEEPLRIYMEGISIADSISSIESYFNDRSIHKHEQEVSFTQLVKDLSCNTNDQIHLLRTVLGSFLALLEMCRLQQFSILQSAFCDDFIVRRNDIFAIKIDNHIESNNIYHV
jgi:segregation and condensation protein A